MLKIVLDTNVLISAILSPESTSACILRLVLENAIKLAISADLLEEAHRVICYPKLMRLMEKHGLEPEKVHEFIERLGRIATVTPGELVVDVIQDDPSDNCILVCAVESESDFIVSGDHHLLEINEYQGIAVISPAAFRLIVGREEDKNPLF